MQMISFIRNKGEITIPLAIAISLIGSVVVAVAGYYRTVNSQELKTIELKNSIENNATRDDSQDSRLNSFGDNMNIMNENISALMRKNGLTPKPLIIK